MKRSLGKMFGLRKWVQGQGEGSRGTFELKNV